MEIQDFLEKYQNGKGCKVQFKSGKIERILFVNVTIGKPLSITNQGQSECIIASKFRMTYVMGYFQIKS